ncbi:MFS transporter [Brevibacillus massiliensis]|uniref:MFS transporter n=1 Tax=Brevibacillus massiliensis TaxID=1118054 RepID=UPI0002F602B2|nr:MFS transporter [Brevibacillus massiliensis]
MKKGRYGRLLFLSAAASGAMLNPLNSSIISLALPRIQSHFHLSFSTVSWLISSFYLSSVIAQPIMGKLADQFGRKTTFLAGLLLVAVSAVGGLWAPTFLLLLLMRLFQSIGSSAIYPSAISMVHEHVREKQASALAVIFLFTSATAALGPTIGGLLIAWGDWPAIFTVNFPFLLVSFLLGWSSFPRDVKKRKHSFQHMLRKLDIPGILLFAFGMSSLLWFLLSLGTKVHPFSGILGVLFLAAFIWWESRAEEAFIDVRMFRASGALTSVLLQFTALNIYLILQKTPASIGGETNAIFLLLHHFLEHTFPSLW